MKCGTYNFFREMPTAQLGLKQWINDFRPVKIRQGRPYHQRTK